MAKCETMYIHPDTRGNDVSLCTEQCIPNITPGSAELRRLFNEDSAKDNTRPEMERQQEMRRIWKNIIIISISFFFLFTAFLSLSSLQSSLHREEGLGVVSQACLYGALTLSGIFFTKPLIGALGHKWSIALSMTAYIVWMAANGYAVWGTMVPASILCGVFSTPLWAAQSAYVTKLATRYSSLTSRPREEM